MKGLPASLVAWLKPAQEAPRDGALRGSLARLNICGESSDSRLCDFDSSFIVNNVWLTQRGVPTASFASDCQVAQQSLEVSGYYRDLE